MSIAQIETKKAPAGRGGGIRMRNLEEKSGETLKKSHAPETVAAGDGIRIAVLLELLAIDIFTGQQVAVGAKRIFVFEYFFPKGSERRIVPDTQDAFVCKCAEDLLADIFFTSGKVALETVPEKVAGVNFTVPGNKNAAIINEIAPPLVSRRFSRQFQIKTCLLGNSPGFFKGIGNLSRKALIPFHQILDMEENVA